MQTPPINKPSYPEASDRRAAALAKLKEGTNPFSISVTAAGTADISLRTDVRQFVEPQLADLHALVRQYRQGAHPTQLYPIVGDVGTGKTHLLYVLLAELRQEGQETGAESMVIVVDHLSPAVHPADYLLGQIVNHLLARKGEGGRMLRVIAGRLTARLLAEAMRQLSTLQQVALIPPRNLWEKIRLWLGAPRLGEERLSAIAELVNRCEAKHPSPQQLQMACAQAELPRGMAVELIRQHLERTESTDVLGWLRKEVYARLARVALLDDPIPFQEFHNGDFEEGPANVMELGNLNRRLLDTWLDILRVLDIPVVMVFDQLEDYLRSINDERERENRRYFTQAVSSIINEVPNVCVLAFSEEATWNELMMNADKFIRDRLTQSFSLPGRPSRSTIPMPDRIDQEVLTQLIQRRIRLGFPHLDLTGLAPAFPFDDSDIKTLQRETALRDCIRALAKKYDTIVHGSRKVKDEADNGPKGNAKALLQERLRKLWEDQLAAAEKQHGRNLSFSITFIPEVQNALDGWLRCLLEEEITAARWSKVDLINDSTKRQYGYLNVIRTTGPNAPGIGVAAWLGEKAGKLYDLRHRLLFFKDNPCPIQTLILLRADGQGALGGASRDEFEEAVQSGRDVRIQQYEPRHFHALMAFTPWHQSAQPEVKAAGAVGKEVLREFLAGLSKELLGWIDEWSQPKAARARKTK